MAIFESFGRVFFVFWHPMKRIQNACTMFLCLFLVGCKWLPGKRWPILTHHIFAPDPWPTLPTRKSDPFYPLTHWPMTHLHLWMLYPQARRVQSQKKLDRLHVCLWTLRDIVRNFDLAKTSQMTPKLKQPANQYIFFQMRNLKIFAKKTIQKRLTKNQNCFISFHLGCFSKV